MGNLQTFVRIGQHFYRQLCCHSVPTQQINLYKYYGFLKQIYVQSHLSFYLEFYLTIKSYNKENF